MVEKDSGRSRGFGFVSYDNRDAAALAIKELNGFAVSPVAFTIIGLLSIHVCFFFLTFCRYLLCRLAISV